MVTKLLSFQFYFKYGKAIYIACSAITNIAILSFASYYLLYGINDKIWVFVFLMFYFFSSNIFNYYLIKSKAIKYNTKSIFVQNEFDVWIVIPINRIMKIKRTYHYFYTIHYINNDSYESIVIFFISPNPSFYKSIKIKEILNYAKEQDVESSI